MGESNPQPSQQYSVVTALPVELPSPREQSSGELGICVQVYILLLESSKIPPSTCSGTLISCKWQSNQGV